MPIQKKSYFTATCFLAVLLAFSGVGERLRAQSVEIGVINLSGNSFKSKTYTLNGTWNFYPEQLLEPEQFDTLDLEPIPILVPGLWHKQADKRISSAKFGTYRMTFFLPDETIYALNINRIQSAYKLWVNGELITEQGKVSSQKETAKPFWSARNFTFDARFGENEIVLQVSNFHHKKSGIEQPLHIGKPEVLSEWAWFITGTDVFLVGVLFIMGVYHLGLYFTRRRDLSSLYYALTMFFSASFSGTVGEILFTKLWYDFDWSLLVKINYISNYLRLIAFVLFIGTVFSEVTNRKLLISSAIFAGVMILFSAVAPVSLVSQTLIVFLVYAVLCIGLVIWLTVKAIFRKLDGSILSFAGTMILAFAAINDILGELNLIDTISLVTAGMFVFTLVQAYLLALRNAMFYKSLELLQNRLMMLAQIKDGLLGTSSNKLEMLLNVVGDVLKMTHGVLLVKHGTKWMVGAEFSLGRARPWNVPAFGMLDNVRYPRTILKHVIETKSDLFFESRKNSDENHTEYLVGYGVQNVYCLVAGDAENPNAVLQFEDKIRSTSELEHKKKVLQTIKPQIEVFIQNFEFYRQLREMNQNLEDNVNKRTSEILLQNEELEAAGIEIEKQNNFLSNAYEELNIQNIEIHDSIQYAKKIQQSVLPQRTSIRALFPQTFIFFKPEEQLSGDFYWVGKTNFNTSEKRYFACADSTGHGVPGALMSIVGSNMLNHAVHEHKIEQPAQILDFLHTRIGEQLKPRTGRFEYHDSIGVGLISYEPSTQKLEFAGADMSLIIIRNGDITTIKPDKTAIGEVFRKKEHTTYTNHSLDIQPHDIIYMFTDGYTNQIGGQQATRFTSKRLFQLLTEIHTLDLDDQLLRLSKAHDEWRGNEPQRDDILVVGIKF